MLRILQAGNSLPWSWPVDPSAQFEPGMIGQLNTVGNNIVIGVSNGSAPIAIFDDIKSTTFTAPSINETIIAGPLVGILNSQNKLVTPSDVKVELNNANVLPNSFISYEVDVELISRNGVVVFLEGTELNIDLDGDGIPDGIRTIVSYSYYVPNIPGDDSTISSGRATVWFSRMIAATDQYDPSQRYPLGAPLFSDPSGKFTTKEYFENQPGVAVVTAPPSAIMNSLEFLWL